MDDRAQILESLPQCPAVAKAVQSVVPANPCSVEELWEEFGERFTLVGGRLAQFDELSAMLSEPLWMDDDVGKRCPFDLPGNVEQIWDAKVGVTLADLAVAESGSLLLSALPGRLRLASLAPEIHVVLIEQQKIVRTLAEAIARLPQRSSVLITGTGRTADIESVMVRGVHGPREIWVIRIDP